MPHLSYVVLCSLVNLNLNKELVYINTQCHLLLPAGFTLLEAWKLSKVISADAHSIIIGIFPNGENRQLFRYYGLVICVRLIIICNSILWLSKYPVKLRIVNKLNRYSWHTTPPTLNLILTSQLFILKWFLICNYHFNSEIVLLIVH